MNSNQYADPAVLLESLQRWGAELRERGLSETDKIDQLETILAQSRGERLDVPADPLLVVMLCGPTAVGKSTLINTLAGEEISRPGLGAETKAAVLYVHEHDDVSRLFEYGEVLGQLARQPHTVVRHRRDELLHKVIIDTPDIDSVMRQHREQTAALVHTADIVLFIVSPEKYKTLDAMQWVARQRSRRALAFVLNKWDREGIGLQYDRRAEVEKDYRHVLAESGFPTPVLFKVSSLLDLSSQEGGASSANSEMQLGALKAWLENGLTRSMSGRIQNRRRRAAWGRIAAAVAMVAPAAIGEERWVNTASKTLAGSLHEGRALARADVATLAANYIDRTVWPSTPGLFGIYAKFLTWCASLRSGFKGFKAGIAALQLPDGILSRQDAERQTPQFGEASFGHTTAELFSEVTERLLFDVETRRLPLQPVHAGWKDLGVVLASQLSLLPIHVEGELLSDVTKSSVRRFLGMACLGVIEILLGIVLLLTFWRMGVGFLFGEYLSGPVQMFNAFSLTITLLFAGHIIANLFFPSLRRRFTKELARRTELTVAAVWQKAQSLLKEHVDAVDRLTQRGSELLQRIDHHIQSLASLAGDEPELQRLFGDEAEPLREPTSLSSRYDAQTLTSERKKIPKFD